MTDHPTIDDILIEQNRSTLSVTLNRPHAKNALTAGMVDGLMKLCGWLANADGVRTVVLRGAGGSFCAGGDIKEFSKQLMTPVPADGNEDPVIKANRVFGDLLLMLDEIPQALVVVVEGAAFGGANGFLAVADIALCDAGAKLSLSETTLGIVPAQIGPFLVRKIGPYHARKLALTGAHFGPSEALRIGLVDHVSSEQNPLNELLVQTLNSIGRCEPKANAATKKILNASVGAVDPAQLDLAAQAFARCLRDQGRVGAMAFAGKQPPPWVETHVEQNVS